MKMVTNNNRRILILLEGREDFKKYLIELRGFLGIPINGFTTESAVINWINRLYKEDSNRFDSKNFNSHVKSIREKTIRGELDKNMANKQVRLLTDQLSSNYLTSACNYIVTTFRLTKNLIEPVRNYIIYNKFGQIPINNFSFRPDYKKEGVVKINLYSSLSKKETTQLLKIIKFLTKDLHKTRKISDITMKELSYEGWDKDKNKYIDERITARDIAEEYYRSPRKTQMVYDAKRRLSKKREQLFG